jgi:hypothetical protein
MESNLKGYCEQCERNIEKIDEIIDTGDDILVKYFCTACSIEWTDTYNFVDREGNHVKEAPDGN